MYPRLTIEEKLLKSTHIDITRETKDSLGIIGTEEFDSRVGHKSFVCTSIASGTQYMVSLHFLGRVTLLTNPQPEKISVGLNVRPTTSGLGSLPRVLP